MAAQSDYPLNRAVEISKMRRLMNYGLTEFKEDWEVALALAVLMSGGNSNYFHSMLDQCFQRMQAFMANNPEVLPFDYHYGSDGAYDDMVKRCKEFSR